MTGRLQTFILKKKSRGGRLHPEKAHNFPSASFASVILSPLLSFDNFDIFIQLVNWQSTSKFATVFQSCVGDRALVYGETMSV